MIRYAILTAFCVLALGARAFWPFDSDDDEPPRLSELMEGASRLIDEASDLASEAKVTEAVEKYREALKELARVEAENPERAETQEFATLRTKRAYVNAAIDSLLLSQVKDNAKAVAVSDTSELEKRLAEEKRVKFEKTSKLRGRIAERSAGSVSKRMAAMQAIDNGDLAAATLLIGQLLAENPEDVAILNLKAMKEASEGDVRAAEVTLGEAIRINPRGYQAYYNMAALIMQGNPGNKAGAQRYYETGRAMGGPRNRELEAKFR